MFCIELKYFCWTKACKALGFNYKCHSTMYSHHIETEMHSEGQIHS